MKVRFFFFLTIFKQIVLNLDKQLQQNLNLKIAQSLEDDWYLLYGKGKVTLPQENDLKIQSSSLLKLNQSCPKCGQACRRLSPWRIYKFNERLENDLNL